MLRYKEFGFKRAEEAFHGGVIQTVSLAGHALDNLFLRKRLLVGGHPVLPSLIGVQQSQPQLDGERLFVKYLSPRPWNL